MPARRLYRAPSTYQVLNLREPTALENVMVPMRAARMSRHEGAGGAEELLVAGRPAGPAGVRDLMEHRELEVSPEPN